MTSYRASKHYCIAKPTLHKGVYGKRDVKSDIMKRPTPYLVQLKMAENIKIMEKWEFGLSKKEGLTAIGQ